MNILQNDFLALMRKGMPSAKTLLSILKEEYDALEKDDLDTFINILERKHLTLSELQNIDTQLVEFNASSATGTNYPTTQEPGLTEEFKISLPPEFGTDATQLWKEFRNLMTQCRHQNAINGRIIHMRQNHTNAALAILRGQSHVQEMNYDPHGKSTVAPSSTHIASA